MADPRRPSARRTRQTVQQTDSIQLRKREARLRSDVLSDARTAGSQQTLHRNSMLVKTKTGGLERDNSDDTSIHVLVRCRGRNERETHENSKVIVRTEGIKGKAVELSAGQNALSDKTYSFDRVFSSAADQRMVYEDAVLPIVDEVRSSIISPQAKYADLL